MNRESTLRKIYRIARSFVVDPMTFYVDYARKDRLLVSKAKWKNNASSPVCLMVDDLANAWFDVNKNGQIDIGEDWGSNFYKPNSIMDFLNKNLFSSFPEIRTTFFTVTGPVSPFIEAVPFTYSKPINENEESVSFFRGIHFSNRFEIAYHGYDHGTAGDDKRPFVQEWEDISSVRESQDKFSKGIPIYEQVFGEKPSGGKTGAYKMNAFIEESIDAEGFFWWCRNWTNKRIKKNANLMLFDLKFFGENGVIDIPSTVHGGVWYKRQINNLLHDKQIISVQEHIAPVGVDGRVIKPNLVDDINELNKLFRYLKNKNVWHATATEIAEYFHAYTFTHIYNARKESFKIKYTGKLDNPILTIMIDPYCLNHDKDKGYLRVVLPDGSILAAQQYHNDKESGVILANIPVQNGEYRVEWISEPVPELRATADNMGRITYNHTGMTGEIKIPLSHELSGGFYKYCNNGTQKVINFSDPGTLTSLCVSSNNETDNLFAIK